MEIEAELSQYRYQSSNHSKWCGGFTVQPNFQCKQYISQLGSLPTGLAVVNGVLSEIPSQSGNSDFTVKATSQSGCVACRSYTLVVVANAVSEVSNPAPNISCLWPPKHQFVPVSITGVTDPDGDPVGITITKITSDEPTASVNGAGGEDHAPDAIGVGTSTAQLRAERSGERDGRVYEITFIADDGRGGKATGKVQVRVPKNRNNGSCNDVDSGQIYDATTKP